MKRKLAVEKLATLFKKLSFLYNTVEVVGCLGGSKDITELRLAKKMLSFTKTFYYYATMQWVQISLNEHCNLHLRFDVFFFIQIQL